MVGIDQHAQQQKYHRWLEDIRRGTWWVAPHYCSSMPNLEIQAPSSENIKIITLYLMTSHLVVIWFWSSSAFGFSNIALYSFTLLLCHILLFGCWIFSIPLKYQSVWIQIRPVIWVPDLEGLIWVQPVCKGYQQTTKLAPSVQKVKLKTTCLHYFLGKNLG